MIQNSSYLHILQVVMAIKPLLSFKTAYCKIPEKSLWESLGYCYFYCHMVTPSPTTKADIFEVEKYNTPVKKLYIFKLIYKQAKSGTHTSMLEKAPTHGCNGLDWHQLLYQCTGISGWTPSKERLIITAWQGWGEENKGESNHSSSKCNQNPSSCQ